MNKRVFSREFLLEELDLPYKTISNEIIDQDRWSTIHEIVFEYEGKFWTTTYSCGSTELQDEYPWDDENEVECIEVEKKMVQVEAWVPVE